MNKVISFEKLILIIIALWTISAVLIWFLIEKRNFNPAFAETFNIINSLFTGLTLAAIFTLFTFNENN